MLPANPPPLYRLGLPVKVIGAPVRSHDSRRWQNEPHLSVSLAYVRDLSHSELATQLQIPLGTVKTWIRRGLDQLRTCMSRFA